VRRLGAVLGVAALLSCRDTSGPRAFDVKVKITSTPNTGGCYVSWTAIASDSGPAVDYQVGEGQQHTFWLASGQFRNGILLSWDFGGSSDVTLRWIVSAGTWSKDKWVGFSCGATWQEP
jgi:hypothetical protein